MKVLITGGLGFLGQHVVRAFLDGGHDVRIIDNHEPTCGSDRDAANAAFGGEWVCTRYVPVDITCFPVLNHRIQLFQPDVMVHLAAYGRNLNCRDFADRAQYVNVGGTTNILNSALINNVSRVLVCSSNITLSDQDTVYKRSKIACEVLVENFAQQGLSVMGLRPSNIYGAGQSRTEYQPCAFAGLDISYARDGHFTITGDGTQSRDFVHADDVADAFVLAAYSSISGCTLDVCTGAQTSMNEVASLLDVDVEYTDPRPGDAKILVSNPEPAKALLGFTAKRKLSNHIFEAFPSVPQKKAA
jgi:UDP-glucose 4-epimerase